MIDKVDVKDIEKWTERIEKTMVNLEATDNKSEEMLANMKAYISDSRHFLEKGDLVRSFESIIWAWAIFEICKELGVFVNR